MISLNEFLVFTGSFLMLMFIFRERKEKKKYPPSLPTVPILGSVPFLLKHLETLPTFFLEKSYKLGPVFNVTFGNRQMLILNSRKAIEDAFVRHASSFSGRFPAYLDKYQFKVDNKVHWFLCFKLGFVFKNYDDEFRRYKKLALSILKELGFGTANIMETRISTEVTELIHYLRNTNGQNFDPKEIAILSASNVPINILIGRRTKYEDGLCEVCDVVHKAIEESDLVLNLYPFVRFAPTHRRKFIKSLELYTRTIEAVEKEIEASLRDDADDSFVRRYVEKEGPGYDRQQLVYTLRDFIIASTDTTATTMLWALTFLADNPTVMERIQKEIDSAISSNRLPTMADAEHMPFTEATILEIQRHRPVAAIALPHLTTNDTEVLGYFVPKDTVVLANLRGSNMHRDDWSDPEAFRPERFLDDENKVINRTQSIPFSLGRRSCPGESLARRLLFLFIAGILQSFTIRPPEGLDSLNVKAVISLVEFPEPFEVRFIPRNA